MLQNIKLSKNLQYSSKTRGKFNWNVVFMIVVFSAITGLGVNFFDYLHHNNSLLQANGQASSAQTELAKEQYDVKFLINNSSNQLNCYDLRSNYARSTCDLHNNNTPNNNL